MPPEARIGDRTPIHYTMKAPHTRPSPGARSSHGRSGSRSSTQTKTTSRGSKPSTPLASPRTPFPVGQPFSQQPKLSPGQIADGRAASPNYFGLIPDQHPDPRDSSMLPRENWSPPTSSVRSFTAAIPNQGPIDANPDYEAFKRQADLNRGGDGFHLSSSHFSPAAPNPAPSRPRAPPRWNTHASDNMTDFAAQHRQPMKTPSIRMEGLHDKSRDSAYVSSDSKRTSDASMQPPMFLGFPRFASPKPTEHSPERKSVLSTVEDRQPRLSMPLDKIDPPSPGSFVGSRPQRAETDPSGMDSGPSFILPSQLKDLLASSADTELLLLDLRVSQQFLQSRIKGSLNLCTPTTLLKRATFNLQKLQLTFQNPADKEQFSKWSSTKNLVVYDSHSAEKRDAISCLNMIKKFANEGYKGNTYILRGGFKAVQEECPEVVDQGAPAASGGSPAIGTSKEGGRAGIPPIMGGVILPQAGNDMNPFFSNIRQNMDLADGVGQLDVSRPRALDSPSLPKWLREASKDTDHGKQVSDKFLQIERSEQSRMKKAYSMFNTAKPQSSEAIQLCGVEKGGKNRYKDILPFEHARVKLQGRPDGACDYVNASHVKAAGSNKRYIATQGPLPATFEDFWSVIWDQDVRVIVMLTAESEGGTLKCHPYWRGRDFGNIKLKLLSEKKVSLDIDKHRSNSQATTTGPAPSGAEFGRRRANTTTSIDGSTPTPQSMPNQGEAPFVIIRKFALNHGQHPFAPLREVTHLHFPSWPDFGTPAQPSHLLALVELANVMQRSSLPIDTPSIAASKKTDLPMSWYDEPESEANSRPMLVHCSAGCGRTGTFCTVDTVMDMLKRQRLAKTVTKPVRKRDSDGDIKMSGEREVEEPISPHTAQEQGFSFGSPSKQGSGNSSRRGSWNDAALDTSWVGDDSVDLIAKTVEDFRTQRLSMVQSLRQYVLCYETVLEYLSRMAERTTVSIVPGTGRARSGSLQMRREK